MDLDNSEPTPGGCRIGCLLCLASALLVLAIIVWVFAAVGR